MKTEEPRSFKYSTSVETLRLGKHQICSHLCQLTVMSSRPPRTCVWNRKLNYQLILLAVVDARSCCCWETVLLLSAPVIGDTLNATKGRGGHLPGGELTSDKRSVSQRGLWICAPAAEELAPKLEPSLEEERKSAKTADGLACFLCLCRASLNRDINFLCVGFRIVFFTCTCIIYIYTLLPLRRGQLARQLTLAHSAKKKQKNSVVIKLWRFRNRPTVTHNS